MPDPQCPNHVHEFERVIINLMKNPEEFSVEGFHDYYSSQELRVLHNLQDALLKVNERNYPLTREEMLHSNDDSANKR
jgi:hypothetical protein